jgi:hypothetical protein
MFTSVPKKLFEEMASLSATISIKAMSSIFTYVIFS